MKERTFRLSSSATLKLRQGDITQCEADAIVNAANERMLGGGGVDGAIHRAAGPELLAACQEVPEVRPGVRCPTGEARITPGFQLPSRYVIHTVGPVYTSDVESSPVLASAYRSCLELANEHRLSSVFLPAVSCGVFGYPIDEAAAIGINACVEHRGRLEVIGFVLFNEQLFDAFAVAAESILGTASERPQ